MDVQKNVSIYKIYPYLFCISLCMVDIHILFIYSYLYTYVDFFGCPHLFWMSTYFLDVHIQKFFFIQIYFFYSCFLDLNIYLSLKLLNMSFKFIIYLFTCIKLKNECLFSFLSVRGLSVVG